MFSGTGEPCGDGIGDGGAAPPTVVVNKGKVDPRAFLRGGEEKARALLLLSAVASTPSIMSSAT
jgi:hypothetical protein